MKTSRNLIALAGAALMLAATSNTRAQYNILHEFAGGADGLEPVGSLTVVGSTIYGMTTYGNTVFGIGTNGTGYTVLHNLSGTDGTWPKGALTLVGSNLYATAGKGGASGYGTIFRIDLDGNGCTNLHSFTGGAYDGNWPSGSLTLVGSNFYGTTYFGGSANAGVIFKINIDGSGYTNLHAFGTVAGDGTNPYDSLTRIGSALYGMAVGGGSIGFGTMFQINTDGSGYTNLYSFTGSSNGGGNPRGGLTLIDSKFYGMTPTGGSSNLGTVFQINTDGSGYTNLHSFTGVGDDGNGPWSSLTLVGSALYGTAVYGGNSNSGMVFRINVDGSGFTNVHSFAGGTGDGATPYGMLACAGPTLYGMTYAGGSANEGVLYALTFAEEPLTIIKQQVKLNFAKPDADSCSLNGTLNLGGGGYDLTNKVVALNIGGAQISFKLDAKGKGHGVGAHGTCKLAYNKGKGLWTLSVKLSGGSWQAAWAAYGFENVPTPKSGDSLTLPVTVTIDDSGLFVGERSLTYRVKLNKSGSAK